MKERPILFSAPMVQAILDGRKTQTRRVITRENIRFWTGGLDFPGRYEKPDTATVDHAFKDAMEFRLIEGIWTWTAKAYDYQKPATQTSWMAKSTFGNPGERLWVRETWGLNHSDYIRPNPIPKQRPADLLDDQLIYFATECDAEITSEMPRCPAIHMPRWASRIDLEITGVRIERLKDISEVDAIAEGPEKRYWPGATAPCHPIICYRHLWETINGKDSWDINPWVWVIEFKRVQA